MSVPQAQPAPEVRAAIEGLIYEFSRRIDHDSGFGVADLFTADGVYALGPAMLNGRAEINEFYDHRREAGPRTSRHLFSNLCFGSVGADRVTATCVLTLHAADGTPPLPLSPVLVADYHDRYVWDGASWLFERRDVDVVFGTVPRLINRES